MPPNFKTGYSPSYPKCQGSSTPAAPSTFTFQLAKTPV